MVPGFCLPRPVRIPPPVFLLLLWIGLVAAGCGSGSAGNGGPGSSPSPSVSLSPPDGSAAVPPEVVVRATFSGAMSAGSIDGSTFVLEDSLGNRVDGRVAYEDNVATLVPSSPLALGAVYTATLSSKVCDEAGNGLQGGSCRWTFSVRSPLGESFPVAAWDNEGGQIFGSSSALGENGDLFVLWYRAYPSPEEPARLAGEVYARRCPAGGSWEPPVRIAGLLSKANLVGENVPGIAVDRNGNALAVWNDDLDLGYSTYSPGHGWSAPGMITGAGRKLALTGDRNGNAVATWSRGIYDGIFAQAYRPGSGWTPPSLVSTGGSGIADHARTTADLGGNFTVVWQESEPGASGGYHYHVWARRHLAGTGWGEAVRIDSDRYGMVLRNGEFVCDSTYNAWMPQVGSDDAGNVVCAWAQWTGTYYPWADPWLLPGVTPGWRVRTARFDASTGKWGPPVFVHPGEDPDWYAARYPGLSVGPGGEALVSFQGWSVGYSPAAGWNFKETLSASTQTSDPFPTGADPYGGVIACWNASDGAHQRLWLARRSPAGGWSPPEAIGINESNDAFSPRLAVNRGGVAYAVWREGTWNMGGPLTLWARRLQ